MNDQDNPTDPQAYHADADWFTAENSTFGDRLAGARDASGMTRQQLARRMGLKVTTIDKWEEDLAEPRANRLQMMSGLLGVSLTWLLTAKGEGPDGPDGGAPVTADLRDILNELRQVRSDLVRETDRIGVLEKRLRQVLKETGE